MTVTGQSGRALCRPHRSYLRRRPTVILLVPGDYAGKTDAFCATPSAATAAAAQLAAAPRAEAVGQVST